MEMLEAALGEEEALDGVVAQDASQAKGLWGLRENVPVALGHRGV